MHEQHDQITNLSKPITGRHVLIGMVCFFGVIIAVNMTMAVFASTSWTGLEVKNSYVASQDYNAKLAAAERQRALGWSTQLTQQGGQFRLSVVNSAGAGIAGAQISAVMKRPVQEKADTPLDFKETAAGDYRAGIPLASGVWDIDVTIQAPASQPYRQIYRVHLKD